MKISKQARRGGKALFRSCFVDGRLDEGRVRLVPKASGEEDRYVEIEGAVDLIVEVVSDSSVTKDMKRLPQAYYRAGVREFWLIDARGKDLVFQVRRRGAKSFEATVCDEQGFQRSEVLACVVRLERERHRRGHWRNRCGIGLA